MSSSKVVVLVSSFVFVPDGTRETYSSSSMKKERSEAANAIDEISTNVLFKNPQKFAFTVNYQGVVNVVKDMLEKGTDVARIKGYPSILAGDVFKEYIKVYKINLFDDVDGDNEKKNHLRYTVGSFNKCLKTLEQNRMRHGFTEYLRIITSCYVYIQCVADELLALAKQSSDE